MKSIRSDRRVITIILVAMTITMFKLTSTGQILAAPHNIIPISQVRQNNGNGVPHLLNSIVEIQGEVTVADQFGIVATIQDETGGVMVYDYNFANRVEIGDFVTIRGTVTQYRGLTEIENVTVLEHITKTASVEPILVTCGDIDNEGANSIENYEGKLLRIDDVTVNTSNWYVTGSGTNYTLSDRTGSCEVRIDDNVNLANTVAPGQSFSLIGVLSQFDYSEPYNSGYQIMPRFVEDIVTHLGPALIMSPLESEITPYSVIISWKTAAPAQSILMYGLSPQYEIDTLRFDEQTTDHRVQLTDLSPATFYHIKAGAADEKGESYADDHIIITASGPECTGEMIAYFNRDVDTTLASEDNVALENQDLAARFIERIQAANFSIDICFYSWSLPDVTDALVEALERGVKLRFIYEDDAFYNAEIERLRDLRIQIIDDSYGDNSGEGLQHNKFAIFDARDNSSAQDDWVWTGSLNMTDSQEGGLRAAQNVMMIQDQALALAFTLEFNEMWGSSKDNPSSSESRFSGRKLDDAPHIFNIAGSTVEMYHSPSDPMINQMIETVTSAHHEIYCCIMAFTRYDLSDAMFDRRADIANLKLSAVFGSDFDQFSQYYPMHGEGDYAWDSPADVWIEKESGQLHHKYMVIDPNHPDSDPVVITGSANWSNSAVNSNDEHILIIHNQQIANKYFQEFARRYEAASGRKVGVDSRSFANAVPSAAISLAQNYPNPFNASTCIRFHLDRSATVRLQVIDITGRIVDTLIDEPLTRGSYTVDYTPSDLATGLYAYRLQVDNASVTHKMILLK
ncbi:T9SS type A sorting domain-containing protein [candidate division KSB1 bacterium]|nr:T9SS type A sorting domain-containing protein [candidate division KSB1 bacterium]